MSDPIAVGVMTWGVVGFVVALAFLFYGFDRIDPGAHEAYAVRPLLVPGLMLLWPLVILRWIVLSKRGQ